MSQSLHDVLVFERAERDNEAVLSTATWLATSFGACIKGLCLYAPPNPSPAECFAIGGRADTSVIEHLQKETEALLAPAEAEFRNRLVACGATEQWESLPYSELAIGAAARARSVDLAVLPRPVRHDHQSLELVEACLLRGRAPCLLIPATTSHEEGFDRIVIAWNGSPEAWHALHGALPFLHKAKAIWVVEAGAATDIDERHGLGALQDYLSSRQIDAAVERAGNTGHIAQELLMKCQDCDADLLVLGAYGHDRRKEAVFGGVTREILLSAPLAVLLSH